MSWCVHPYWSSCLRHASWANTGGRSSVVGFQAVHPLLGLISAGIGPHWQEVAPVCEHLTAGCLNCSVYDSSPATMPRRQVPINGGQTEHLSRVRPDYKLAEFQNFWQTPPNQPRSALLATVLCWKKFTWVKLVLITPNFTDSCIYLLDKKRSAMITDEPHYLLERSSVWVMSRSVLMRPWL